jgi:predicted acyltransferase
MPRQAWLDVFRGLAVVGMFLVNYPGSLSNVYWPLVHAGWHGATPADFVFPAFLFAVGVSISYSALSLHRSSKHLLRTPYCRIFPRTLIIFALGLALAGFPNYDLATLRVTGVLQRVAICYLIAAVLFLNTGRRTQAAVAVALLVGYQALMMHAAAPNCGAAWLTRECNFASHVDRLVLGGRAGAGSHDPEGLLSTLPAIVTTIFGVLAGQLLQSKRADRQKTAVLVAAGVFGIIAGLAWHPWFPINKSLWTSSYVLLTAGVSCLLIALCYAANRVAWWATPFQSLGVNALAAYVMAELGSRILVADGWWHLPYRDGRPGANLQTFLYERLFSSWTDPYTASLLYAVAYSIILVALMTSLLPLQRYIRL